MCPAGPGELDRSTGRTASWRHFQPAWGNRARWPIMGTPVSYDAWLTVYDSIRTLVQSLAPPIRQCSRFVVLRIDKICQKSVILIYTRSCEEPFQSMRSYGQFAPGYVMDRFQFLLRPHAALLLEVNNGTGIPADPNCGRRSTLTGYFCKGIILKRL